MTAGPARSMASVRPAYHSVEIRCSSLIFLWQTLREKASQAIIVAKYLEPPIESLPRLFVQP